METDMASGIRSSLVHCKKWYMGKVTTTAQAEWYMTFKSVHFAIYHYTPQDPRFPVVQSRRVPDFEKDDQDMSVFYNETTRLVVFHARRTPKI